MGNDSKKSGENNSDSSAANAAADSSPELNPVDAEYANADAEVGKLAKDLEDLRQTLLRRQADFDNYRKRVEKERSEDSRRTTARLIEALIPVIDSFDQALASHREPEYANYRKGFELIHKQLLDNIGKLGAERVEPVGMKFDPHLHQAMDRTETTSEDEGTILQVFQPGYVFHGRVLRPAMVRVAVHPTAASKTAN
ncbi:MAG TPA: nucleotide exchange factor GrpE [Verrucomicrobiae bacterium]|jgi:molecular chaperone GrpE|nr:nucleotide exchange factor GrpE [Verrucomicrobiae bacterium]